MNINLKLKVIDKIYFIILKKNYTLIKIKIEQKK